MPEPRFFREPLGEDDKTRGRRAARRPERGYKGGSRMNNDKIDWAGSFVAVVTPFDRQGEIDWGAFRKNLENLLAEGAYGLVVSGCTGESWSLSDDEKVELFKAAVDVAGENIPVIAGTGSLHTETVVELSRRARDAGAAGVMVLPPYYCRLGRLEILAHYRTISEEVEHPILLYNIPSRVGRDMTADLVSELAEIEWVVAIKESSDDYLRVQTLIREVGERINIFAGHSAERAVPSVLMGAKGFVSSMESQVIGKAAIGMYDLIQKGDLQGAAAIQLQTHRLDVEMRTVGTFPANLKTAMNELGRPGGYPRGPLLELNNEQKARVREILEGCPLVNIPGVA